MNKVILVGRLVSIEFEEDTSKADLTLAVNKPYKNDKGIYDKVIVLCKLKGNMACNTKEYCKQNDIIGISGTLENKEDKLYVVAEKISFLSSKSK